MAANQRQNCSHRRRSVRAAKPNTFRAKNIWVAPSIKSSQPYALYIWSELSRNWGQWQWLFPNRGTGRRNRRYGFGSDVIINASSKNDTGPRKLSIKCVGEAVRGRICPFPKRCKNWEKLTKSLVYQKNIWIKKKTLNNIENKWGKFRKKAT